MNPKTSLAIVAAIAILAIGALLPSCIGSRTKPLALFPPAQLTWPAVEEDLARGIADGVEDGDLTQDGANEMNTHTLAFGAALDAHDLEGVRRVPWSAMAPWAERGIADKIDDGEISPGVAASLREQLSNFGETIRLLQGTY